MPQISRHFLLLCAVAAVTIAVYWPGLSSWFIFDDFPNIADNAEIHISTFAIEPLKKAAISAPYGAFIRPMAMISFALNWLASGDDPWPMKATNLAIHVLNGLLLYAMLRALLRVTAARRGVAGPDSPRDAHLALAVSACWLLLPINLTAVLYVVQRMESLCQLFVLAGLWAYLYGRRRMLAATAAKEDRTGLAWAVSGLIWGTGLGLLAKESAVMLPVYAFLVEATLLRFQRRNATSDRRLWFAYLLILVLPAIVGFSWLLPRMLNPNAWAQRLFTLAERLLTEPRVLFDYVRWTVLPDSSVSSLYHDDIEISRNLLSPITTLSAISGLAGLVVVALASLRRFPLCSLGILWFLAAHLLTATIVPLELVFEHRNYFASIGVLLAVFSLLQRMCFAIGAPSAIHAAAVAFAFYFGTVTYRHAQEWSSPQEFVIAQAIHHPGSVRANYTAGQVLITECGYQPSALLDAGLAYLRHAATLPDGSILPEQALIIVANRAYQRDAPDGWQALIKKLESRPIDVESLAALNTLNQCFVKQQCQHSQGMLLRAYRTALAHSPASTHLLRAYADFLRDVLHDGDDAAVLLREAAEITQQASQRHGRQ